MIFLVMIPLPVTIIVACRL